MRTELKSLSESWSAILVETRKLQALLNAMIEKERRADKNTWWLQPRDDLGQWTDEDGPTGAGRLEPGGDAGNGPSSQGAQVAQPDPGSIPGRSRRCRLHSAMPYTMRSPGRMPTMAIAPQIQPEDWGDTRSCLTVK
jgi:hypothetical protein